ncbi:MAG: hypothetical protein JW833_14555, partial [Prolixibacteraceae bacterium]|nr:hypothetical protein [Prolixibacteraceae bacterium]
MKKYILIVLLLAGALTGKTQEKSIKLTLSEVLNIAASQSIDAFRNKNMYLASYWQYRYYQAERLPSLSLSSDPVDFNRYRGKEYNFQTNQDEFRYRQYFNSDVSMSLSQNITPLGGRLYLQSGLEMIKNLGGDKSTSFTSTPVSINYMQELNGYNEMKWQSKIEPLKYEKAKKDLIQNNEELNQKAVTVFFSLA